MSWSAQSPSGSPIVYARRQVVHGRKNWGPNALYGTSPADLRVALASLIALIAVALLAATIPAHRAASLDPTQALRAE